MKNIILASGSPRRRELLSQIGLEYKVVVSDTDENIGVSEPKEMVCGLSRLKALAVWNTLTEEEKQNSVVIGADTVVAVGGSVLGKPKDKADAFSMIKLLSGGSHSVYTGVALVAAGGHNAYTGAALAADDNHSAYMGGAGRNHSAYTPAADEMQEPSIVSLCEGTKVNVYPISDEEIHRYIATGEPMDKAGAYGIQGAFAAFVEGIEGDYNNVVGLPVARVYQELRKAGYIND